MTEKNKNLQLFLPVYIIFLLIYVVASFIEPTFFSWNNNVNLFTRITPLILIGIAQTFVILTGGIDLSVGSVIGLANVIAVSLPFIGTPGNIILWFLVPTLVGLAAGLVNGFIITRGSFPPLIVTLATGVVWQGVSLFILSEPGGKVSRGVSLYVTGKLFNFLPVPLLITIFAIIIFNLVLRRTAFGRSIYAIGGNEMIAFESGINCNRNKIWVYGLSGFLAGLVGLYLSAWMSSGDPLIGNPYVLNSIAIAVIGGTSLAGGTGGVLGIIGGAYIWQLLNNILNLMAVSMFYQYIAKGLIIIIALAATASAGGIRIGAIFRKSGIKGVK
ncbi:MAG: ABC transporter permease [Desulfobacterales bacterium]|nr:ABC transporter permease [Desulfobacterales bacterium]